MPSLMGNWFVYEVKNACDSFDQWFGGLSSGINTENAIDMENTIIFNETSHFFPHQPMTTLKIPTCISVKPRHKIFVSAIVQQALF
jgi:hypothetical protein